MKKPKSFGIKNFNSEINDMLNENESQIENNEIEENTQSLNIESDDKEIIQNIKNNISCSHESLATNNSKISDSILDSGEEKKLKNERIIQFNDSTFRTFTAPLDVAAERFQLIAPLILNKVDKIDRACIIQQIAEDANVSPRTIRRWEKDYLQGSLQALAPKYNKTSGSRIIPPEILDYLIKLRQENPCRGVEKIIYIANQSINKEIFDTNLIKRSTLQAIFFKSGLGAGRLKELKKVKDCVRAARFQHEHRNDLWQTDIKYGPYINGKRTYLIAFIDDCSRLMPNGGCYLRQSIDEVLDCLIIAIEKYGVPRALYCDNGRQYSNHSLNRACAILGIRLLFTRPRSPESKGKIERLNGTFNGFIQEFELESTRTLENLIEKFDAWASELYNNASHSALNGKTPLEVFNSDKEPLRFIDKETLDDAFLRVEKNRKVDKVGCITFHNEKWEIQGGNFLIGKKVDFLYSGSNPDIAVIECHGHDRRIAKKLIIKPFIETKRLIPPISTPNPTSASSLLSAAKAGKFRRNAESNQTPSRNSVTSVLSNIDISKNPSQQNVKNDSSQSHDNSPDKGINFNKMILNRPCSEQTKKTASSLLSVTSAKKKERNKILQDSISFNSLSKKKRDN
jgi:transposase InsO family protein